MRTAFFSALALAGCMSSADTAPVADATPPRTVEIVQGAIAEQADHILTAAAARGFSGAAMIEIDGELVFARGYGGADREARRLFAVDTIAQIGSIAKPFTAAAPISCGAVWWTWISPRTAICRAPRRPAHPQHCANR